MQKSSTEYWQTKYNNTLEGSYTKIKWDSSEMQRFFNIHKSINVIDHINKLKNKNPMIISIDTETVLTKIQKFNIYLWYKFSRKWVWREYTSVKVIHDKPTANIVLNGEKLKAFPPRSRIRHRCSLSQLLFK